MLLLGLLVGYQHCTEGAWERTADSLGHQLWLLLLLQWQLLQPHPGLFIGRASGGGIVAGRPRRGLMQRLSHAQRPVDLPRHVGTRRGRVAELLLQLLLLSPAAVHPPIRAPAPGRRARQLRLQHAPERLRGL